MRGGEGGCFAFLVVVVAYMALCYGRKQKLTQCRKSFVAFAGNYCVQGEFCRKYR